MGEHRATVPNLHHRLVAQLGDELVHRPIERGPQTVRQALTLVAGHSSGAARALQALLERCPRLEDAAVDLARAYVEIARSQGVGGTLFLAGNGGSMADALHISFDSETTSTKVPVNRTIDFGSFVFGFNSASDD